MVLWGNWSGYIIRAVFNMNVSMTTLRRLIVLSTPPYSSFRFENELPEVILLMEDAIESYLGKVEWCMSHHPK